MCSCHSIPECCVMFSGVKLSIRSFILLLLLLFANAPPINIATLAILGDVFW